MFLAVSPMLWQAIHFLNDFSPAAISPATAAPAEYASATIAIETLFIIPRDPFLLDRSISCGGSFNSFQRRNTPVPANFTADRAAEDGEGEAYRRPAPAPPLSAHARRRRIEK